MIKQLCISLELAGTRQRWQAPAFVPDPPGI